MIKNTISFKIGLVLLMLYVPVNNFSIMKGGGFSVIQGWTSAAYKVSCSLAKVSLELAYMYVKSNY